jgi:hypothetical protein
MPSSPALPARARAPAIKVRSVSLQSAGKSAFYLARLEVESAALLAWAERDRRSLRVRPSVEFAFGRLR